MTTPTRLRWSSACATHVGKVRRINEDACLDRPEVGVWAVADGMGGHAAGDVASQTIVDLLRGVGPPTSLRTLVDEVEARVLDANRRLQELAASRDPSQIIGSTVAVLVAFHTQCVCLWAGDSRIYRYRAHQLAQLTEDHTYVQELVAQGHLRPEDAAWHPAANVITRAVGADETLFVDADTFELQPGDRFLLCSDGLTKELSEADIAAVLEGQDCAAVATALVDETVAHGAQDNVTVVVVDVDGEPVPGSPGG